MFLLPISCIAGEAKYDIKSVKKYHHYYIDVCVSHSQGNSQAFENCDET